MAKAKTKRQPRKKGEPQTATCENCEAEIFYLTMYGYWVHSDDYLRGCYTTYVATPAQKRHSDETDDGDE